MKKKVNKFYKKIIKDRVDAFLKESISIDLLSLNGLREEIRIEKLFQIYYPLSRFIVEVLRGACI
jgi:reverse gyrase